MEKSGTFSIVGVAAVPNFMNIDVGKNAALCQKKSSLSLFLSLFF